MKFLVDAQLPRRFANWLNEAGHDALHTLDLPRKNFTPDYEVIARAKQDERIVVSKDADFVQSFLINGHCLGGQLISSAGRRGVEKPGERAWQKCRP
ncbi:MAG: hypothetical protein A2V79_06355 [Betaproteobacteria bacterium RBG_16_56_24]|nr:MAG: hypothetical protein A2V79_06355 [Betaproteobacteria bacterium RBG_16_56_24]